MTHKTEKYKDNPEDIYGQIIRDILDVDHANPLSYVDKKTVQKYDAEQLLHVYRHTIFSSLYRTLSNHFEVTKGVFDHVIHKINPHGKNISFKSVVTSFIHQNLPEKPILNEFGGHFPSFLFKYIMNNLDNNAHKTTQKNHVEFLFGLAKLEWSLLVQYAAKDEDNMNLLALGQLDQDVLLSSKLRPKKMNILHEHMRGLIMVYRSIKKNKNLLPNDMDDLLEGVAFEDKEYYLITRHHYTPHFIELDQQQSLFYTCLLSGMTIQEAILNQESDKKELDLNGFFNKTLPFSSFSCFIL